MKTHDEMMRDWQYLAAALYSEIDYLGDHLRDFIDEGDASIKKLCGQHFEGKKPGEVEQWDGDGEVIKLAAMVCDTFEDLKARTDCFMILLQAMKLVYTVAKEGGKP